MVTVTERIISIFAEFQSITLQDTYFITKQENSSFIVEKSSRQHLTSDQGQMTSNWIYQPYISLSLLARQVLYHLSHSASFFLPSYQFSTPPFLLPGTGV
jgi:hypothetical protein